jgi:hypothetical protein
MDSSCERSPALLYLPSAYKLFDNPLTKRQRKMTLNGNIVHANMEFQVSVCAILRLARSQVGVQH